MKRKIDWRRGSGTFLATFAITLMTVALTFMYLAFSDSLYTNVIATTRADAVADSVALYAQSYDYKYNKGQAGIMTTLLGTYNTNASNNYSIVTSVSFPADDVLSVRCEALVARIFPTMTGDYSAAAHNTEIKSVDIWGDVLVVPESVGQHTDDTPPPNAEDADAALP